MNGISSTKAGLPFRVFFLVLLGALGLAGGAANASAEVVRMEIESRESFADGHVFGRSGAYEKIIGRLYLEVDANHPANRRVTDLKLAPRNANGKVEFWTEFFLLKPVDISRGNRRLFYDVDNRGRKLIVGFFNNQGGSNPTTLEDAGNGFLMRQGYSILWCAWNGDVKPGGGRMLIHLPVARQNGRTITGKVYAEITVDEKTFSQPFYWGNSVPYPAVSLDHRDATVTMRPRRSASAVEVRHEEWSFARRENGKAVPDPTHLYLKEGFRPGWLYDLVYTAKNPRVTGLGFVAVRDAVSFFRYEAREGTGKPNPLVGGIERAYIFGVSQSGRFIHHLLYEGFNGDMQGRMVFDGAMAHVGGAGKGQFNYRFSQTTRHGTHHQDNLYPSDFFPFNTVMQHDPITGAHGDSLARSRSAGHLPKIFLTETSTEYWSRAGSLLHTDVEGKRDVGLDPSVRLYFLTGAQHGVSRSSARGNNRNPVNVLDYRPLLRALLVALDRWVTTGEEPPASRYPRIADGTLVNFETHRKSFPKIPDAGFPEGFFAPLRLDPGPRWHTEGIADHVPPKVGPPFRTLVPAVDADGNELAGSRLPDVAVPLATYTGWNLRAPGLGAEGILARLSGSYFKFPRTPDERKTSGDPRLSVAERYTTREAYLSKVAEAALKLERERFLLKEDVVEILRRAAQRKLWGERASGSNFDLILRRKGLQSCP